MYPFLKRSVDIIMSLIAIAILSPFAVVIAILIYIESPGPVLYVSKRVGQHRRVFKFFKFRTMVQEADELLLKYRHLNQYDFGFVKIDNDPRVTRVGSFLRRTSLDEIPQFINVLKGDMSIVGNRPLPIYEADQIGPEHDARFDAEAGITGLWQVTQRGFVGKMDSRTRLGLDVLYANSRSAAHDTYLMMRTIPAMFQKSNS